MVRRASAGLSLLDVIPFLEFIMSASGSNAVDFARCLAFTANTNDTSWPSDFWVLYPNATLFILCLVLISICLAKKVMDGM